MKTNRAQAIPTVQIDNERVKVTEWRFPPDSETGWHRHEFDYVVVPEADGTLTLETAGGNNSKSALVAHRSYFRQAGVEHNVINAGDTEFAFVEIEIKS